MATAKILYGEKGKAHKCVHSPRFLGHVSLKIAADDDWKDVDLIIKIFDHQVPQILDDTVFRTTSMSALTDLQADFLNRWLNR